MRFSVPALLLATNFCSTLARPTLDIKDIERRWSEGQSEAEIHSAHTYREATPAWPVVRSSAAQAEMFNPDTFEATTDERTMLERNRARHTFQRRSEAGAVAKMRQFVENFMRSRGEMGLIGARADRVEEAPVLRPRKGIRYRFTA